MTFALIARDNTEEGTLQRRQATREAHLALVAELKERGIFKYGGALLGEDGQMNGSILILEYPSEALLQSDYLAREPYIEQRVWADIQIQGFLISPHVSQ